MPRQPLRGDAIGFAIRTDELVEYVMDVLAEVGVGEMALQIPIKPLLKALPYDPVGDFMPISGISTFASSN